MDKPYNLISDSHVFSIRQFHIIKERGHFMNSINVTGRLTKDPSKHNKQVFITLAVDRFSKDSEQSADFLPVAIYGASADNALEYLSKGDLVALNGRLQSYKDKDSHEKLIISTGFIEYLETKRKQSQADDEEVEA